MRKCPGSDPVSKAVPELFPCPKCDTAIEIWSDEVGGKCSSCNTYFKKIQLTNMSDMLSSPLNQKNAKIKELIQDARPSMSGFGINVAKLIETAGWTMSGVTHDTDSTTTKMANVYGLVLIC
jgi:hypothetical protein